MLRIIKYGLCFLFGFVLCYFILTDKMYTEKEAIEAGKMVAQEQTEQIQQERDEAVRLLRQCVRELESQNNAF